MSNTNLLDKPRMPARKTTDDNRDRIDLRAEPELVARATRQAKRLGISLSAYIRLSLTLKVEQDEAAEPAPRKQEGRK
jgi:predicted HicB family RNase H-like nuclease